MRTRTTLMESKNITCFCGIFSDSKLGTLKTIPLLIIKGIIHLQVRLEKQEIFAIGSLLVQLFSFIFAHFLSIKWSKNYHDFLPIGWKLAC